MNISNSLEVSISIAWAVGLGGVLYGVQERRLRKRTVERLAQRNQALELKIDPERTSSQLTSRGDTNPEDEE